MSTTNDAQPPFVLCDLFDHLDPDNTGMCIKCHGILQPDLDDWKYSPEECVGDAPKYTGSTRFPDGVSDRAKWISDARARKVTERLREKWEEVKATNDPQAEYGEQPKRDPAYPFDKKTLDERVKEYGPLLYGISAEDLPDFSRRESQEEYDQRRKSKLEPLLSEDETRALAVVIVDGAEGVERSTRMCDAMNLLEFKRQIQAKIASGELMVVKTVKPSRNEFGSWECPICYQTWFEHDSPKQGEFCKCGAKIIES